MLVHSVFFYLKSDLTNDDRNAFEKGVKTLATISAAEAVYVGSPADTAPRPVIDTAYDIGLTVVLKDVAAHDAYQEDPIHTAFVDQFKGYWEKVVIYDAA